MEKDSKITLCILIDLVITGFIVILSILKSING